MSANNHRLRIVLTAILGAILMNSVFQFKYSDFIFDILTFGVLGTLGITLGILIIRIDWVIYKKTSHKKYLVSSILWAVILFSMVLINWKIESDFNKPTLLKIFYDGDFNGTGIDFKLDGTYIFNSFCLGSSYQYGKYQIEGDKIILDKSEIENIIKTSFLRVLPPSLEARNEDHYVYQINENGAILENVTKFRVVEDNRE